MTAGKNIVIIGAGPAGISTAIVLRQREFPVTVLDARLPPIDKVCGEGILPHGVEALRKIGIHLDSGIAFPFAGIRFVDENSTVCAEFGKANGFALRRVKLHELLVERAVQVGVEFQWGTHVVEIDSRTLTTTKTQIPYDWLIGADGQNSTVRKWAHLNSLRASPERFGFRRHFQVNSWTDVVEVHWASGCQLFVTPIGAKEYGVAVFSRDPHMRLDQALPLFPAVEEKLRDALPITKEMGDTTCLRILPAVTQGNVALVGDASGTMDALTGHGLGLSFQQAIALAEAIEHGDLKRYEVAHGNIRAIPMRMTRAMLLMERSNWTRRRTLRMFQTTPGMFSKLLSIHAGTLPASSLGVGEIADFSWKLLRA